jgi:phytoene synthase
MMAKGSLSFTLAARLFDSKRREGARFLYAWCRYCDDAVDRAGSDRELARRNLRELREMTESALRGEPQVHPVFFAFQQVALQYKIPREYAMDLLAGMEMDVAGIAELSEKELDLYCYRVAGVVGLMMSHVMGLSSDEALSYAVSAGNAMQMTNISRDVLEDAAMGRVYLPREWLADEGLVGQDVSRPECRAQVTRVVKRLLSRAQGNYVHAERGLKYLPLRAAFAVAAAIEVYSEIGKRVLDRGEKAWDTRTVVPASRKLWVLGRGVLKVLAQLPERLANPWRARPIEKIWRPV